MHSLIFIFNLFLNYSFINFKNMNNKYFQLKTEIHSNTDKEFPNKLINIKLRYYYTKSVCVSEDVAIV